MLPILNYHILHDEQSSASIREDEAIYANEVQEFQRQIGYFCDSHYQGILLEDYIDSRGNPPRSPFSKGGVLGNSSEKSVVITFDDGHASNYTYALPILQEHGFAAVFFVTVKNIGSPGSMSWHQIREMADNGMSIQSHTMTHPFLSDLSPQEIRWELQESKTILEQQLGRAVDYLSLPGGRCNSTVKEIAKEVGYRALCTSIVGYNDLNSDLYSLRRWVIRRNTKLSTFDSIVRGKHSVLAYHKARYFFLGGFKKVLGNQRYVAVREKFL
jgi:peptidoglycan/xylan/chitin deacetylase (PgdA/CDA1 family)